MEIETSAANDPELEFSTCAAQEVKTPANEAPENMFGPIAPPLKAHNSVNGTERSSQ